MHRRILFVALLSILVGGPLTPKADAAAALASGKGVNVTQEQLDDAFINLRATLATQGKNVPEAQRPALEQQLVEKLALTQILLSKATDDDRQRAKEKVAKLIAEEKTKAKTQARFEAQIRASGMSPESFEKQLNERAICEEVLDRELRPRLGVTGEKVKGFYDANAGEFKQPERLRLQQVVFALRTPSGTPMTEIEKKEKRDLAEQLVARARKGEDFAALARQYSDDPAGRERGGEYLFPVGRMVPEFEAAVLPLATNDVSNVILTPYSYHVVKLLQRMPGEVVPFESVTNQIRMRLELEATQALLPDYQKQLFKDAGVEFKKAAE